MIKATTVIIDVIYHHDDGTDERIGAQVKKYKGEEPAFRWFNILVHNLAELLKEKGVL